MQVQAQTLPLAAILTVSVLNSAESVTTVEAESSTTVVVGAGVALKSRKDTQQNKTQYRYNN